MKRMSKIIVFILVFAALAALPVMISAESEPALKIEAANLSFEDSVYPVFAVSGENVDMQSVKLLVWTSPKTSADEYIKGTENAELSAYGDETIDGVACKKFKYTKIYAKNMTDDIYVRAYAEVDGEPVYSGITKYSVLRYAYNKLGYTGTATTDANLKEMLEGMLIYGAGAQKYFDYKTDRLATSKFYKITVEGGYLPDGTSSGLFLEGEKVALCAPGIDKDGKIFVAWSDDEDNYVSRENSYEVLLKSENMVLKSTYSSASNGLEFSRDSFGCYVAGIGSCSDVDIVIPAVSPDGDRVKAISYEAFKGCSNITSVTIPDSVTFIDYGAFKGCSNLTSITIPNGVTSIGNFAFDGCSSLTSITIPDGVTNISAGAFYGCSSLTSITIPAGVTSFGNIAFYDCSSLKDVHYTGTIENWCNISFNGSYSNPLCNSANLYINEELVTELTIPDSITEINDYVFYGCRSLITVTIGNNITSIGCAFWDCDNLTSVTIDNGVTTIGGSAFRNCRNLTNITIPDSVTSIGPDAFWSCSSLVYNDYDNAYYLGNDDNPYVVLVDAKHYDISSVEINVNTKVIYDQAFINCSSLTSITIPDGVTCIGGYVFMRCSSLTSITIPDGITNIGDYTFCGCSSLTSITIPDDVTSIGWCAFEDCSSLTDIYYTGSEEQWSAITIESDNAPLTNATIHYNYVPEN